MNRLATLLIVLGLLVAQSACSGNDAQQGQGAHVEAGQPEPRYAATLAEGINFAREGLPDFLSSVSGLSVKESWGRWSDATTYPAVTFTFKQPLPQKFTVVLSALCTKENENIPIRVLAGAAEKSVTITKADTVQQCEIAFDLKEPATTLVFIPAKTSSPKELGLSEDLRHLAIGFAKLSIVPR